ncbi:MAG: amidase [Deltaproteobacteria bacterium]|nr:amidase [Deltaproteobacteria bacterium]
MRKKISSSPAASRSKFDPNFGTATQALKAIRAGAISSRELTRHVFTRIHKHNEKINAFITLNEEQALRQARRADAARAAGKSWGPLHGLPIVIKDQFRTAGLRTTCGFPQLADYVPETNAVAVQKLLDAGAIILGKTNTPIGAGDIQTYNKVAGTTNNPWDLTRTSGGSTGGGAAALAAGFGFLELGADLAGSIRTPSNFCGVCGHKSSLNLVTAQGAIPPLPSLMPPAVNLTGLNDLAVVGPLARSAADLKLALEILAGPAPEDAAAYRLRLPKPRKTRLKDYKIGYVTDDPFCPVTSEIRGLMNTSLAALRKEGVQLKEGWPAGVSFADGFETYFKLMAAYVSQSPLFTDDFINAMKGLYGRPFGETQRQYVEGLTISHKDWVTLGVKRLMARRVWQDYFKTFDAFLMPANCVPAFMHDRGRLMWGRTVDSPDGPRYYVEAFKWISVATLAGCPATVIPVGQTKANLPVGLQVMGPYLEDGTSLDLAMKMEKILGGFTPPPGFDD